MAKRISKKLLAGLGGALAFSTTALVGGLGIKTIVNNVQNNEQRFNFNRINEAGFNQIPNLSVPTRDMFLDTTRLGNFHAGTVRKGQTLTPWGWLGLYEEDNKTNSYSRPSKQKLALTGWNGEILWINDEFRDQSFADNKADIFDIKYDWNTDLIILTRSGNPNGLFKPVDVTTVDENNLMIDVLEAKTGTKLLRIQNGSGSTNDLHDFAWKSFFAIRDHFFDVATDLERIKDLYSLDVTSLNGQQNQALAFYMPNFMQLYQKNQVGSAKTGTLPNFAQVIADFQILARGWIFDRGTSDLTYGTRIVDPNNSNQISGSTWTFNDAFSNQSETLDTRDFYLLTNPFWTAGKQTNQFVLHFIVANDAGDTYHKTIGFNLTAPQPNLNTVISEFDKTEKIGSASINTNDFNIKLKANEWGNNAASWHQQFINANLKINKNMFDNNLLTFAFPIAASQNLNGQKNFPLFDVAQIKINDQGLIDRTSTTNQLSSRVFNLGTQILNSNNLINPWPVINNISPVHNYNRLISVSPFDNTFIYSAMANLQGLSNSYNANDLQNKFLSFWLVNAKTGEYKPFVISNDSTLKGSIPTTIAKVDNLITEGFSFDLKSLDNNGSGSINLYFNHSGSERNDWFGSPEIEKVGLRSAKIGLLDDFLSFSNNWTSDVTSSITNGRNNVIEISNDSFSTLIHSRANMNKWYSRTEFNFERPGNLFQSDEQINSSETLKERVQANVFNQAISDPKVKKQDGVDLVSHWQVGQGKYGGNSNNRTNYERLVVKRPKIKVKNQSTAQALPIITSYNITNSLKTKYQNLYQLSNDDQEKLNFKFEQTLTNASWEIFSSWSKDAKITQIGTSSDNSNLTSSLTTISGAPEWFDVRKSNVPTGDLFGKIHNAISPNNGTNLSLRTMLQIEKPANAPAWINNANSDFFKPYPIDGTEVGSETNFSTALNQFLAWKVANVDLGQEQNQSASGLANLTIKASLQVNPQIVSNNSQSTLYRKNKQQILLINNEGQAIIYNDKYNDARIVYDQQATEYKQMKDYGFGQNVQTALQKSLKTVPDPTTKFLINLNFNNLNDTLLRKNAGNNDAILSIDYQSQAQNKIVIKAANDADQAWFVNRFSSFNKMLNLFVVFEYQDKNDSASDPWKQLEGTTEKLWTDDELKDILQQNHNQLILPTDKKDIKKIRVRLVSKTTNGNPTQENDFIKWNNWDANNAKLISSTHIINPQPIKIDKNWFANTVLSSASNSTLDQLSLTDVQNYETLLNNQLKQANSNADHLIEQVEIKYQFENQSNLNATELVNAIISALGDASRNDKGFFTLWNGIADNGLKIKAYFQLKSGSDADFILIDNQGTPITDLENRSGDVRSNIATKIDLSDYFNQLQTNPLKAIKGNQVGQLNSFEMPDAATGNLNEQNYQQIKTILNNVGLDFQFKEWINNNWSSWMEKDNIVNYNPQDPAIMIGLKIETDWNVKVIINSADIDNSYNGIKVNLHLPKLVKADENVWNTFKQTNTFSGNTYQLDISNIDQAETILKEELINFNNNQNSGSDFSLLNQQLEIKYRLGTSGAFQSAQELQKILAQQTNQDQKSNQIWFQISLNSPNANQPDFELDSAIQVAQELLSENNQTVKKFLHGQKYETELNQILVTGSDKENLSYSYGTNLQKIIDQDSEVGPLRLEWTYKSDLDISEATGSNPESEWVREALPTRVNDNIKNIYVRIQNSDATNVFVYGPDTNVPNAKIKGTIDLSQITTIIRVNKEWLKTNLLSSTAITIDALEESLFTKWQKQVFSNINISDASLLSKITIKFTYKGQSDLSAANLVSLIKTELKNYSADHLGIIQLWDGQNNSGERIQATFVPVSNDGLIKIQDMAGNDDLASLTDDVNTANIKTVVNLIQYVQILETKKTNVTVGNQPGEIISFEPPAMPNNPNQQFSGRSYEKISNRLENLGINIVFSQDGTPNGNWTAKNDTNHYDIAKGKLFLAFENRSTNIEINLKNNVNVNSGADSKTTPLSLVLNAPKRIFIDPNIVQKLQQDTNLIGGNTKNISISNLNKADEIVREILEQNVSNSTNPEFNNAPLQLEFQVANFGWVSLNDLENHLRKQNTDAINNEVKFRFVIPQNESQNWLLSDSSETVLLPNNNQSLKIFVHDDGLADALTNQTTFSGSNNNLTWIWPDDKVNSNAEIIKAPGIGLKIEFTYNANVAANDPLTNDPITGWSAVIPNNAPLGQAQVWIRIVPQPNYVYEKDETGNNPVKIALNLTNIKQEIPVKAAWLNQELSIADANLINNVKISDLNNYENSVFDAIGNDLQQSIKDQLEIRYSFSGETNLDKQTLFAKLNNYQQDHSNTNDLGILQLWNGYVGQEIKATFIAKNPGTFIISPDNIEQLINTTNVKSAIDLTNVINWIQTQRIEIVPGATANTINGLKIPNINTPGDLIFNGKSWSKLEQGLKSLGLQLEYSNYLNGEPANWDPDQTSVNKYDDRGQFRIRFKLITNDGSNLKIILPNNQILEGNANVSNEFLVNLKVKKAVLLNEDIIKNQFINQANVVSGNTKNLKIDANLEKQLIQTILNDNVQQNPGAIPSFASAPLKIEYRIGNDQNWLQHQEFIDYLAQINTDQQSNKISFRFIIETPQGTEELFSVNNKEFVLSEHQAPNATNKIHYFINSAQLEDQAQSLSVSGKNSALTWNWGNLNVVEENNFALVQLTNQLKGLVIEFTTKTNPQYSDPDGTDNADLNLNWSTTIPRQIDANTQNLSIRLRARDGFVYENQENGSAAVHSVALNIKFEIQVQNDWISNEILSSKDGFITGLKTAEDFLSFEQKVLNHILEADLRQRVELKFIFNNETTLLSATEISQRISTYLNDFTQESSNYGLLQLWNGSGGIKIQAQFAIKTGSDNGRYEVVDPNGSNNANDLTGLIQTQQIKTLIDLQSLINLLKATKISFTPGSADDSIKSLNLPAFPGSLGQGFLQGLTFEQIEKLLDQHGIIIQWRAVKPQNTEADWGTRQQLTSYDPGIAQFEIRFNFKKNQPAQAANLVFSIEAEKDYEASNQRPSNPIKINLRVAKKIQLNQTFIDEFKNTIDVVIGNTKLLEISETAESKLIENIINENATAKPDVIPSYTEAKLVVLYSIGDLNSSNLQWLKREQFQQMLEATNIDQNSNQINFKFDVENANSQEPDFTVEAHQEILSAHQDANDPDLKIKYYINEGQWEQNAASIRIEGKNTNLQWMWNNLGSQINERDNKVFVGSGLRLEFTTKSNPDYADAAANEQANADLTNEWVTVKPIQILAQTKSLAIRLKALTGYVYGPEITKQASVKLIPLENLRIEIPVDKAWLNQPLTVANEFIEQITINDINQYVNQALNHINDQDLRSKVKVVFSFNGQNNLNPTELLKQIQAITNQNQAPNYGILQLHNGVQNQGKIIMATFALSNPQDRFEIINTNGDANDLTNQVITTQIKTHIDLRSIISFLQNQKLEVQLDSTNVNQIVQIMMPNTPVDTNKPLSGMIWSDFENRLKELGVQIEARPLMDNQQPWTPIEQIHTYDPTKGKIELRFSLDQTKASNIILSTQQEHDVDANQQNSTAFEISLKVPLTLAVPDALIQTFIQNSQSGIQGNTKFLSIDSQNETTLIQAIIDNNLPNNNDFNQAKGRFWVEYQLGDGSATEWFKEAAFIEHLKQQTVDQITNAISFRFQVSNTVQDNQYFQIDTTAKTIFNSQIGNANAQIKIYINEKNFENLASQIKIKGTNNNFSYVFPTGLNVNSNGQIDNVDGLRIQYTTKSDQINASYSSANTNPAAGWVDQQPTTIDPISKYLAVQLVGGPGYIYGGEYLASNNQPSAWQVHTVNVEEIKSEIAVDPSQLNGLALNSLTNNITEIDWNKLKVQEQQIINQAVNHPDLAQYVGITYQISADGGQNQWFNQEQLKQFITAYQNNFTNDTGSILKFNGLNLNQFTSIQAHFESKNEDFIIVSQNSNIDVNQGVISNTTGIITTIDLSNYVAILNSESITFDPSSSSDHLLNWSPPQMNGAIGDAFLTGLNFEQIQQLFNVLGIVIEFQAPGKNNDAWVNQNAITSLNRQNELYVRFRIKMDPQLSNSSQKDQWAQTYRLKTSVNDQGILTSANEYATDKIKLKVDLPIVLDVNAQKHLTTNTFIFSGNTWQLQGLNQVKAKVQEIVNQVLTDNSTIDTDLTTKNVPLTIKFSLNNFALDANGTIWYEIEDFVKILAASNTNWTSNEIKAKFILNNNKTDASGQKYELINDQEISVLPENISNTAQVKLYIHKGNFVDQISTLKPIGSTENYTIPNLNTWKQTVPTGLIVQFSKSVNPDQDVANANWNIDLPMPLDTDKNLWLRFEVEAGYEYADALATDNQHSAAQKLDTSNLRVIIKLQSQWLEQIIISGNTRTINNLDESAVINALNQPGILPSGKQDLIELQYSIDQKNWMAKDSFINFLEQQKGRVDQDNFIILRESLMVRFNINPTIDFDNIHGLNIDGQDVDDNNRNQFNKQLITNNRNQNFEGYINLDFLKDFQTDNFSISGTTSKPKFNVKKATELNTLLEVYVTEQLFDIQLATEKDAKGSWVWQVDKSILTSTGQLIDQNGLINQNVTLTGNKFFAMRFVAKNSHYKVYAKNLLVSDGQILDISNNVHVTVEIENPFVSANKSIALQFRTDSDQPKYYQGAGGFKATVVDANGLITRQSIQSFLKSSNLTNNEKEALEFVYHVFDNQPSEAEFLDVARPDVIKNYASDTWKSLDEVINNADDFTNPLNLKVGQYVTVALRVKQNYAQGNDPFVLKNDQHSVLDPVGFSNNKFDLKGRVNGYLIKSTALVINENDLQLANMNQNNLNPLDGFALLQRISLKNDPESNYLGVDLKIKYFDQFHKNANGEIITVGNQKLVKRTSTGAINKGNFTDSQGNEILDENQKPIPNWVDDKGKPSAPITETTITREKILENFGEGIFGFDMINIPGPEFGLFKNQKIEIEFIAKKGLSTGQQQDYYLDRTSYSLNIQDLISPKIKFAIDNPKNISYSFVQEDFLPENIKYEGNDVQNPEEAVSGSSHVATPLKMLRTVGNSIETITGSTPEEAVQNFENQLKTDFNDQLKFEFTYIQSDGGEITKEGANIYQLRQLKNNDRIIMKIVSKDPELIFLEAPNPLIINVKGLIGTAPDKEKLRFLRVEQNGQIDGQGTFRILVDDPQNDGITDDMLLRGWKFMIQVWDANKTIKIPWTDQQDQIRGLANGDKVEWKLVDERNNHVQDAYYNTVAQQHEINPTDGSTIYNFAEVNYQSGSQSQVVYRDDIGAYPESDQVYPENSGFVISGLEAAIEKFPISENGFSNVFNTLNPTYEGINGQGALKFDEQYLNQLYYVDTEGRLNARSQNELKLLATNSDTEIEEVTLSRFLANVTFFTADPRLEPLQNGFKFTSNETNITNYLKNGDQLWAQFDVIQQNENSSQSTTLTTQLPDVNGLSDVPDNMGPLWFVLMGAGTVITLGLLTIIYFWLRHRKLK